MEAAEPNRGSLYETESQFFFRQVHRPGSEIWYSDALVSFTDWLPRAQSIVSLGKAQLFRDTFFTRGDETQFCYPST